MKSRQKIIKFLMWDSARKDNKERFFNKKDVISLTDEELIIEFFIIINNCAEQWRGVITFDEIIQYSKKNNFYHLTCEKLVKLLNDESLSEEFYLSLL